MMKTSRKTGRFRNGLRRHLATGLREVHKTIITSRHDSLDAPLRNRIRSVSHHLQASETATQQLKATTNGSNHKALSKQNPKSEHATTGFLNREFEYRLSSRK